MRPHSNEHSIDHYPSVIFIPLPLDWYGTVLLRGIRWLHFHVLASSDGAS